MAYADYFQEALRETLGIEGGFSNDPVDRGGATAWGITEPVARAHGYTGPMDQFPLSWAERIYKENYWNPLHLSDVARYSTEIARELFDTAVNQGVRSAGTFLQRALNLLNRDGKLFPDLTVDGLVGPVTLSALAHLGKAQDKRCLFRLLNTMQGARYIDICEADPSQERFIRGWMERVTA